ncbi:MAG TPA: hypothetical protein VFQ85_10130 [Mycobacteriales bacterium]|jgi:hypothetical protein|nr:hypothetical protein [Mycobacteriales bacterium]
MPGFRRALDDLAGGGADGTAPADRAAAVRARARTIAARRRAAVAGGVALTVAAVAGVAVGRPDAGDSVVPASTAAAGPAAATTTAPPSPTLPTSTPPAVTTTAPAPAVTTAAAAASGPAVTIRPVRVAPTGQESEFEVHVVDPYGGLAALQFSFGVRDPRHVDEFDRFPIVDSIDPGGDIDEREYPCDGKPDLARPVDTTFRYRHTFRFPGTYTAFARAQTRSCAGAELGHFGVTIKGDHVAETALSYAVTGDVWPNGPARPVLSLAFRRSHPDFKDTVDDGPGTQVNVTDDGALRRVRVDWGDGTAEDVAFGRDRDAGTASDCDDPDVSDEFAWPSQTWVARPDHTYAQPGSYTVTVTVTTASCDGTDEQTATTSGTWDWPPPSASPTPSEGATP